MSEHMAGTEIAIVGLAGRFPGAADVNQFWANLRDGVESITFFTDDELRSLGVDEATLAEPGFVKAAANLDGIDLFDASFFDINRREAEITDPQHRVFLECAWEALESAGYAGESYRGAVGVYGGATINTYLLCNVAADPELIRLLDPLQINIGNGGDFLTTRVSYKLNLKGPSHLIQSACSTSLVAVHVACQSLLNGECNIALAGGVSINVRQLNGYHYKDGGMTSPDGHCRAFDSRAQGTIFGSGAGVVVLKRMEDALADGDTIHAVVKGSAVNNDGSLKVGFTAPSVDGQAEVIAEALANAGVGPESITYVEAHGTATPLGDPIEMRALMKAFRAGTSGKRFCAVGTVKTNIGHLDAAAGIAGLIKTVLALKHKQLPPSLHYRSPNPQIDFASSPFFVNDRLRSWETEGETPLRAGVSSFGVGGTNAHVILEEAPEAAVAASRRRWQVLTVSARSETALAEVSRRLAARLEESDGQNCPPLADVAYTLQAGRQAMRHRRAVVCEDAAGAARALSGLDPQRVFDGSAQASDQPVVFMFPGQGSQYVNMGLGLYQSEPAFRLHVDRCADILTKHLPLDELADVLYRVEPRAAEDAEERLGQTHLTQPALFVIEYALAQLWISWGVKPVAMIGHSLGEYVAACLAGVMTLEDALGLVVARGRIMRQLPSGAMLAVEMCEREALTLIEGEPISLAAVNAPDLTVVSGEEWAIAGLERRLGEAGVSARRLRASRAFHSHMAGPAAGPFALELGKVKLHPPEIPYVSNVAGKWVKPEEATDPGYWCRHLLEPVRFAEGLRRLFEDVGGVMLEVGPGRTLCGLARRSSLCGAERPLVASLGRRDGPGSEAESLAGALAQLWVAGAPVDWPKLHADEKRRRVVLPTYPFERQRYWVVPKSRPATAVAGLEQAASFEVRPNGNGKPKAVATHAAETLPVETPKTQLSLSPRPRLQSSFVAPAGRHERAVAEIWERALGVGPVGVLDSFFDLGGDSLVAIQVIAKLKESFNVEVPVVSLYENMTIRSLVELLKLDEDAGACDDPDDARPTNREEKALRRKQYLRRQREIRKAAEVIVIGD